MSRFPVATSLHLLALLLKAILSPLRAPKRPLFTLSYLVWATSTVLSWVANPTGPAKFK